MHFLLPGFLTLTALAALPLLLHLLRLQPRKRIPFPSLRFLGREALRDSNRHRIRRWLTLLLRCAIIGLIVAAFCRPFWPLEHSNESRAVVVVVDNSYSMQTSGRRAAVEAWLAPQLVSLRPPDQVGVLLLHPAPDWLVPLGDNLDLGRAALKSLPSSYETSNYRPGLELAAAKLALSAAPRKQLLLAADQQRAGWRNVRFDRPLPPGVILFPAPAAPAPKRQAAITLLKATRTADGKIAFDATIRNYSPDDDERTLRFFAGGEKLGEQRCTLPASRPQTIHAEFAVPRSAEPLMLHATLDADDLTVDDTAYAALAGTTDRRLILAPSATAGGTDFLALALGAIREGGKLPTFRIDPLPTERAWAHTSVAVLRGPAPFRAGSLPLLDRFLDAGGSAWILCDGSPEQTAWLAGQGVTVSRIQAGAGKLKLRDLILDHPVFAPFAGHSIAPLLAPTFTRGWSLDGPGVEPLARWPDRSVAIAEVATGRGRLFITGFGETRTDSTLPIEVAYVPFVHQVVTWLAQNQMAAPLGGRVGTTLVLPGAGTWRSVLTPGPETRLDVNGYVTPTVPGIYQFEQPQTVPRYYAVNLDHAESDLAPWPTPEDFPKLVHENRSPPPSTATAPNPGPPVAPVIDERLVDERTAWWWLLAAAVALLFLELALANRTIP